MVGNKCDLDAQRQVSKEQGQQLAKQLKIGFREASAKLRLNVEEAFFDVVRGIRNARGTETDKKDTKKEKSSSSSSSSGERKKKRGVVSRIRAKIPKCIVM